MAESSFKEERQNFLEEERQLHLFHFTASQFYEDFRELTVEVVREALNKLQELLVEKFPTDEDEIKTQITALGDLYLAKAAAPLKKFEETAKEIFHVPSNIVLPGFEVLENLEYATPEEVEALEKECEDLEKQIIEEKIYNAHLLNEVKKFKHVEPLFKKVNEVLQFYKDNKPAPGEKSLTELFEVLKKMEAYYYQKKEEAAKGNVNDLFSVFPTE